LDTGNQVNQLFSKDNQPIPSISNVLSTLVPGTFTVPMTQMQTTQHIHVLLPIHKTIPPITQHHACLAATMINYTLGTMGGTALV